MAEAPLTLTQGENVILQLQIITSGAPWCRVGELHHIITIGTDRNIFRYALIMLGAESLCFQITFEISLAGRHGPDVQSSFYTILRCTYD